MPVKTAILIDEKETNKRIRNALKTSIWVTVGSLVIAIVAIVMVFLYGGFRLPEKYESTKSFFFEDLKSQIDLGVVKDIEDVEMVRHGVVETKDSKELASADLEGLLAEYGVVSRFLFDSKDEKSQDKRAGHIHLVKKLIKEAREKEPFSILPKGDRSLATELKKNIERGEKELASNQLDKLMTSLGKTISVVSREAERNRLWSITSLFLAAVGIGITILIFLISGQLRVNRLIKSSAAQSGRSTKVSLQRGGKKGGENAPTET